MDIAEITPAGKGIVVLLGKPMSAHRFAEEIAEQSTFLPGRARAYDTTDRFKQRLTAERDYGIGPSEHQRYFIVRGDLATLTDIFEVEPGPASRNGEMDTLYHLLRRL